MDEKPVYVFIATVAVLLTACSPRIGGAPTETTSPNNVSHSLADAIVSGGVPKDGIPSIDNPTFVNADEARLGEDDVVFGVANNGTAKAYPQNILVHHEIVNDQITGNNVSVTYCPLTGTAMGFHRDNTTLGVSGKLVNSNLIMYDRATNSYFPQIMGEAISGEQKGNQLDQFRVVWTTWKEWKQQHPTTKVLSDNTGFLRDYNRDPYGSYTPRNGYYANNNVIFPTQHEDERLDEKDVVYVFKHDNESIAVTSDRLQRDRVLTTTLNTSTFTFVHDESLNTARLYNTTGDHNITYKNGSYSYGGDTHTATSLPLEDQPVYDAFWFAWAAFNPDTELYE